MIDRSYCADLVAKQQTRLGLGGKSIMQHLDRNIPIDRELSTSKHDAEAAARDHAVHTQPRAQPHRYVVLMYRSHSLDLASQFMQRPPSAAIPGIVAHPKHELKASGCCRA